MEMRERPILMTPEDAQKCHEGTKTQTRRILSRQPWEGLGRIDGPAFYSPTLVDRKTGEQYPGDEVFGVYDAEGEWGCICPFGRPGDRLWVREAWAWPGEEFHLYKGRPGDARIVEEWKKDLNCCQVKWTPSIHMPRFACRTVLEITEVRVERVQDISAVDTMAEGVVVRCDAEIAARVAGPPECGARMEFFALWESINGKGSWERNDWVWVLTFRQVA